MQLMVRIYLGNLLRIKRIVVLFLSSAMYELIAIACVCVCVFLLATDLL